MANLKTIVKQLKIALPYLTIDESTLEESDQQLTSYLESRKEFNTYKQSIKNKKTRDAIETIIKSINLPVKEIAELTNISKPTLYKIINDLNERNIPDLLKEFTPNCKNKQLNNYYTYIAQHYNTDITHNVETDSISYKHGAVKAVKAVKLYGLIYAVNFYMDTLKDTQSNFTDGYQSIINSTLKIALEES